MVKEIVQCTLIDKHVILDLIALKAIAKEAYILNKQG